MHYLFISAQKVRLTIKGMLKNISKTTMKGSDPFYSF